MSYAAWALLISVLSLFLSCASIVLAVMRVRRDDRNMVAYQRAVAVEAARR